MDNRPDKKVGDFLTNIAKKDVKFITENNSKENSRNSNDLVLENLLYKILTELQEMKDDIREIVEEDVRNVMKEELAELMENATLITEDEGDFVQILVGGTHLKGKMQVVQKK